MEFSYFETFARKDGERKMSVIFHIFAKKEGNSRAISRIFSKNMGNLSHFIRHIFHAKVSIYRWLVQ